MLDVEVSPITSQQQNTDDRDSPALHTLNRVVYINDYGCIEWVGNELT